MGGEEGGGGGGRRRGREVMGKGGTLHAPTHRCTHTDQRLVAHGDALNNNSHTTGGKTGGGVWAPQNTGAKTDTAEEERNITQRTLPSLS